MPIIGGVDYSNDYVLRITDSGCYAGGWTFRLPSHGWCWFEFAVWYRGAH